MLQNIRNRFEAYEQTKFGKIFLKVVTVVLVIELGWTTCWSLLGNQCMPHSNIFGILISCICGKLLGMLLGVIKIPPLIGMIAAGIFFRNVPYLKVAEEINVTWSSILRTGAFVILLLRAGLGLKLDILRKNKLLVTCLSILPCIMEVVVIAVVSKPLLQLPWNWSFLLGFVIAGVSPAVVIPGMLSLVSRGYGTRLGVPTLVMAAATADNAFTITGFSVALTFLFPSSESNLVMTILKGPLEVIIGGFCGIISGYLLSFLPPKSPHQTTVQWFMLCLVGFTCVFGLKRLTFSGAGVLATLVMATVAAQTWKSDNKTVISDYLQNLWLVGETLLFTLVGAQVDLSLLSYKLVGYGLVCLVAGVSLRCAVAYISVNCSKLNVKEKLFVCASWTPKATVQAAIGSIALDRVMERKDELSAADFEKLYQNGVMVLCIAVLAIIVTSPPGAALISLLGPKLLDFASEELEPLGTANNSNLQNNSSLQDSSLQNNSSLQDSSLQNEERKSPDVV